MTHGEKIGVATFVVAGLVLMLVIMVRGGDGDRPTPGSSEAKNEAATETAAAKRPSLETTETTEPAQRPREPKAAAGLSYRRDDGAAVTDHRRGAAEEKPSRPRPQGERPIAAEHVVELRNAMRPAVRACQKQYGVEHDGGAKLVVKMTMSARGNSVTVSEVSAEVSGVEDGGLADCVVSQVGSVAVPAAEQEDFDSWPMTMTFPLKN